tara:strand:+ start:1432 stop:1710 length:279 start_codon:yes stop_codon:yes gene_type:complete
MAKNPLTICGACEKEIQFTSERPQLSFKDKTGNIRYSYAFMHRDCPSLVAPVHQTEGYLWAVSNQGKQLTNQARTLADAEVIAEPKQMALNV